MEKVWRIGSNWGGKNVIPIFKEYKIAFAGEEVESNVSGVKQDDIVCITSGQSIVGIGVVHEKKMLKEISPSFAEQFANVTTLIFKEIYFDSDPLAKGISFGKYHGRGKQFHQALSEYSIHIKQTLSKIRNMNFTNEVKNLLLNQKQIILQGAPGTGKTFQAKDIAEWLIFNSISTDKQVQKERLETSKQFKLVQFHPAYTYEDFVRGIIVKNNGKDIIYSTEDKIIASLAKTALEDESKANYVLIIDEINRSNLPAVLGELIYALEYRGETVSSMYAINGSSAIIIPDNLFIIGTMNTADRSVGHIDYAIRRRFAFVELLPKVIDESKIEFQSDAFRKVSSLFVKEIKDNAADLQASEFLSAEFVDRPQDVWLGHSYFIKKPNSDFNLRMKYEIIPILEEYIKDGILLQSAKDELKKLQKVQW